MPLVSLPLALFSSPCSSPSRSGPTLAVFSLLLAAEWSRQRVMTRVKSNTRITTRRSQGRKDGRQWEEQVHADTGDSNKAMNDVNRLSNDVFEGL